jgi:hypothetical protein
MSMGYRSTLAGVVAAVLFAVTWPVCDQLAGLSIGASSAVAGVLAIAAFWMTLRVTRPGFQRVRHLQTADARPNELRWRAVSQQDDVLVDQAGASEERDRELPEKPVIPGRPTPGAGDIPARERARTLATQRIQLTVDDAGMQVRRKRRMIGGEVWEEHIRIQWSAVTAIGFATGRYDPIVALYAWVAVGKPHHLTDSQFLDNLQWTQLSELVAEATSGRLTLDVAGRYNPRSIWPDL